MAKENKKTNPLLAAVKPLARQYVNDDTLARLFEQLTAECPLGIDEKPVLLISKGRDGRVYGGIYAADSHQRITEQFSRQPLADLLMELLK